MQWLGFILCFVIFLLFARILDKFENNSEGIPKESKKNSLEKNKEK